VGNRTVGHVVLHNHLNFATYLCSLITFQKVSGKGVVRIADFGTFSSRHSKARTFNVPTTERKIDKPAVERPKFKAYDGFKKRVNK
jgi:nucleoid DNA-binding protein